MRIRDRLLVAAFIVLAMVAAGSLFGCASRDDGWANLARETGKVMVRP